VASFKIEETHVFWFKHSMLVGMLLLNNSMKPRGICMLCFYDFAMIRLTSIVQETYRLTYNEKHAD